VRRGQGEEWGDYSPLIVGEVHADF
jgi:hypothetical protein